MLPKMMFAGGATKPGEENSLEKRETLVTKYGNTKSLIL